jgi:hypothetical protein
VIAPTSTPARSTTATSGLRKRAMSAATSSSVASGGTVAGRAGGRGRQSPTVRSPSSCQNASAWGSSMVRTSAGLQVTDPRCGGLRDRNVLVYLDDNHLSATYSTTMAGLFADPLHAAVMR